MSKKAGKISLLLGLSLGTIAGVLFAPSKGKELRKNIRHEINKGGTGISAVKRSLKGMAVDMVDTADQMTDKSEKLVKMKRKAKTHVAKAKARIAKVAVQAKKTRVTAKKHVAKLKKAVKAVKKVASQKSSKRRK